MRAVIIPMLGGPEVLTVRDLPEPVPGPGEVAIRVAYAGVNYIDVMTRRGDHGRMADRLPIIPGHEVSGHIHAIGAGVEGFRVGQRVAAFTGGAGYAEVAIAPAALTIPLDAETPGLATAAALPAALPTAYALFAEVARLRPGESVLVHAAAGGVGSLAGQVARHLGAGLVLGTVGSAAKIGHARGYGYDHVFLRDSFVADAHRATEERGVDVIVESIGGRVLADSLTALAPLGRLLVIGNATASVEPGLTPRELIFANAAVMGFSISALARRAPARLAAITRTTLALVRDGAVRVEIAAILPLARADEAHRRLEERTSTGKIVLEVAA